MAETLTLPECKAIVYKMLSQSPTLADNTIARCVDDISTDTKSEVKLYILQEDSKNIRSYQNVLNMENVCMSSCGWHSKGFINREKEIQCWILSHEASVCVWWLHTCCSLRTGCGAAKYRPVFDQQRFWLMAGAMMQSCFKWWVVCKGRHKC